MFRGRAYCNTCWVCWDAYCEEEACPKRKPWAGRKNRRGQFYCYDCWEAYHGMLSQQKPQKPLKPLAWLEGQVGWEWGVGPKKSHPSGKVCWKCEDSPKINLFGQELRLKILLEWSWSDSGFKTGRLRCLLRSKGGPMKDSIHREPNTAGVCLKCDPFVPTCEVCKGTAPRSRKDNCSWFMLDLWGVLILGESFSKKSLIYEPLEPANLCTCVVPKRQVGLSQVESHNFKPWTLGMKTHCARLWASRIWGQRNVLRGKLLLTDGSRLHTHTHTHWLFSLVELV